MNVSDFCNTTASLFNASAHCPAILEIGESSSQWLQGAIGPAISAAKWGFHTAKWSWDASGRHFGPPGQLLLLVAVGLIARNLLNRRKPAPPVHECQPCHCSHHRK